MTEARGLKYYMTRSEREKLAGLPTWHSICFEKTGKCRPGKTARDRAKKGLSYTRQNMKGNTAQFDQSQRG